MDRLSLILLITTKYKQQKWIINRIAQNTFKCLVEIFAYSLFIFVILRELKMEGWVVFQMNIP